MEAETSSVVMEKEGRWHESSLGSVESSGQLLCGRLQTTFDLGRVGFCVRAVMCVVVLDEVLLIRGMVVF